VRLLRTACSLSYSSRQFVHCEAAVRYLNEGLEAIRIVHHGDRHKCPTKHFPSPLNSITHVILACLARLVPQSRTKVLATEVSSTASRMLARSFSEDICDRMVVLEKKYRVSFIDKWGENGSRFV